jgi:hypothetical protein
MSKRAKTAVYLLKIITSLLLYRAATMARQLLMIVAELFQKHQYYMKRILLSLSLLALFCATGCSQQARWNHKQKEAMREALRQYRDMVYLEDLTEPEFVIFTDGVATEIEEVYPVYTAFIEMPGVNDTVDMFVVTTIVDEINTDAHNMRHIYPYRELVSQGILPDRLTHSDQRNFYRCLAKKVNATFSATEQFMSAVIMADSASNAQITQMQQECAADLFNWVIEVDEVDIIEN